MPNASLIVETALLLLAAFLVGCVFGYLARRLTMRMPAAAASPSTAAAVAVAPAAALATAQLVVAPTIAPIPSQPARPSPAQRLAAAAGRPMEAQASPAASEPPPPQEPPIIQPAQPPKEDAPVAAVDGPPATPEPLAPPIYLSEMQPARVAGETTSGRHVANPHEPDRVPPVSPAQPERPVVADEVPPIDEAAQVIAASPPLPAENLAPAAPTPVPSTTAPEPDAETAARQAVEGGWTPPRRSASAPVPLPEAEAVTVLEADAAMAAARSAVASASAAAAAVLAQHQDPVPEEDLPEPLPQQEPPAPKSHGGFGKPETLAAPRDGRQDDLTRIKGLAPVTASALNALGIFHFDQIADWDQKAVVWVEGHLGLKGRIGREKWIEQARTLAGVRPRGVRPRR